MPRLIIIRAGENEFATQGPILLGRQDPDLSENGRLQSWRLAEALTKYNVSAISVSPQKRCIATAMPLTEHLDVFLHPVSGFLGGDLGEWEGKSIATIRMQDRSRYESWLNDPDFPAPGGESMREIYARMYHDLAKLVHGADDDVTLAFVLQESILRAVVCAALDLPIEAGRRFSTSYAGFSVFERMYPGGPYHLVSWNNTSHLAGLDQVLEYEEEFSS